MVRQGNSGTNGSRPKGSGSGSNPAAEARRKPVSPVYRRRRLLGRRWPAARASPGRRRLRRGLQRHDGRRARPAPAAGQDSAGGQHGWPRPAREPVCVPAATPPASHVTAVSRTSSTVTACQPTSPATGRARTPLLTLEVTNKATRSPARSTSGPSPDGVPDHQRLRPDLLVQGLPGGEHGPDEDHRAGQERDGATSRGSATARCRAANPSRPSPEPAARTTSSRPGWRTRPAPRPSSSSTSPVRCPKPHRCSVSAVLGPQKGSCGAIDGTWRI